MAPGARGLGPPACLAMMIWSTLRTVTAASAASRSAHLPAPRRAPHHPTDPALPPH